MDTLRISLNRKITTYLERRRPLMALQGARRAGKTYTTCQWLLLNAYNDGDVIFVASMTDAAGRRGAYEDCKNILRSWGAFGDLFEVYKSPRHITCKRNNTTSGRSGVMEFASFDDPETAKGSACDWVFINEANKFTLQQYLDLAANARKGVIIDYNPNQHFWIDDQLAPEDILLCSWEDNRKHLTEAQLAYFQKLYDNAHRPNATAADWYYYQVYYLNEYSDLAGDIFTPAVIRKCAPEDVPWSELRNPCVFGDPSALVGADWFPLTLSAVEGWCSRGDKFDRILAAYETIRERVVFVEQPRLAEYLKQVYEFARKCPHDDNIDNIASVTQLHKFIET